MEEVKVTDNDGRSARDKLRSEVEAAMEDPAQWADEPIPVRARRSEKRQRGVMISVRLTPEELETVQTEAAARGLTVSGYMRDRALEAAVPQPAAGAYQFDLVVTNRTSKDLLDVVVEVEGEAVVPAIPYVFAHGLEPVA